MKNRTGSKELISIQALQIIDALLVFSAVIGAFWTRNSLLPILESLPFFHINARQGASFGDVSPLVLGFSLFMPIVLDWLGFYRGRRKDLMWSRLCKIIQALLILICGFALCTLILSVGPQNRSVLVIVCVQIVIVLLARSFTLNRYYKFKDRSVEVQPNILIAGDRARVDEWLANIDSIIYDEVNIVGYHECSEAELLAFESKLVKHSIERVVFVTKGVEFQIVAKLLELCELLGVEACIVTNFIHANIAKPRFDSLYGEPMLVISSTPTYSWSLVAKNVMDRVGAFLLIAATLPLWCLAILGIWHSDGKTVFYRQDRAGRYGRKFKMWKFRSMYRNAENQLEELKAQCDNQMSGPVFKLDDDPRVFPFGEWMRKTSVDELPQLINVLLGDMSLVGPRPMALYEIPEISKVAHRRKLSVKPGITCIWQVEGRNTITSFDDWVALDLKYIDEWSLWLDVKILCRTIPAVLFRRGAK